MSEIKISTKGADLGKEMKAAIQRLEENIEANAPPLIIEDLSYNCLYKFARMMGYDLRHNPIDAIKGNFYESFGTAEVKCDMDAFHEFTDHKAQEKYSYY